MKVIKEISTKEVAELPYFELTAYLGISGHIGGLKATKELIRLTKIGDGIRVLDVGCGTGKTACYIAKHHNCSVIGVDTTRLCIEKAKKLAEKAKLKGKVEFKVADIYNLPYKNESYDVVITENVFTFLENKDKALKELIRITEPGGHIGSNVCFRSKKLTPVEKMKLDQHSKEIYRSNVYPLTLDELKKLFEKHDLKEIKFLIPNITFIDKLTDLKEGLSRLKILLRVIYLSILDKNIGKRFLVFNKNYRKIKKGVSVGFQIIVCRKI